MRLTKKQVWVMQIVVEGYFDENGDHHWLDLDQLLEKLPYETTKQSIQFTLRTLTKKYGLVCRPGTEIRRGRNRRIVAPTPAALRVFKPRILRRKNDAEDFSIADFY